MRVLVLLMLVLAVSPWVIYRKSQKKKLVCKEEGEWLNGTETEETRRRRDIQIDPEHKEPIIFIGTEPGESTIFIDDGDFDIVSEHLTDAELEQVKLQIMQTCNALNSNP